MNIILYKRGHHPLTIRKCGDSYEILAHKDAYRQEYWERLPQSGSVIEAQIELYKDPIPDNVVKPMGAWNEQIEMEFDDDDLALDQDDEV